MTMDLFSNNAPTPAAATPAVTYKRGWARGRWTLEQLQAVLPLEQRTANMYGKVVAVPRLECWHGMRPYAFGGRVEHPKPWPELLEEVRAAVNTQAWLDDLLGPDARPFDSCFVNLYRGGRDCIPWHADDEPWIGPVIASVTFGDARRFVMRHKATGAKASWLLGDGDLLVMHAGVQQEWEHSVPRTEAHVGPRLNLTFRQTLEVRRG
jgi:alkylated DNA repair dioxygenase AlkB